MSTSLLILGNTGTGKSTSIETLNPETTFIIQCVNKELPFKGFKKKYPLKTKEQEGNRYITNSYKSIGGVLQYINSNEKIKTLIIDDITYLMTNEFVTTETKGYDKFNDIAQNFYTLINKIKSLREDLIVVLLGHEEVDNNTGRSQIKTVGKLLNEKICIEGMFSIVLNTLVNSEGYHFQTQNNGYNTTKSPKEMFELLEPNDLQHIINKIEEYYKGDDE
jgi:hypothetical protein F3_08366|nr:MAG TPA: hypothetical protein [Caudoviricetes sp.]